MLQSRLIRCCCAAVTVAAVLAACGGKPIEKLERTGITAMEQASALACSNDEQALDQAIQAYTQLEGSPPPDQAALVASRYLREPSQLHDVVDGQIVPIDPGCGGTGAVATTPSGSPPMTAPSTDGGQIVTSTEPPLTPEQMLAEFTPEEVAEVGGAECAGELASLFVAAQNYVAEQGKDPETIDDLTGHLDQTIDLLVVEDGNLRPAPGLGCTDINDASDPQTQSCQVGARTLQVAREAYLAQIGQGSEPTQQELVDIGLLRETIPDVDLSDGTVVAVAGGACEGVELGL